MCTKWCNTSRCTFGCHSLAKTRKKIKVAKHSDTPKAAKASAVAGNGMSECFEIFRKNWNYIKFDTNTEQKFSSCSFNAEAL